MDNFLVSRIPIDIVRENFQAYKIQDKNVQKQLIKSVTNQFSEDEPINPNEFEKLLLEEIIKHHQSL